MIGGQNNKRNVKKRKINNNNSDINNNNDANNNSKIDKHQQLKNKETTNTKIFEKHLIYWENVPNNTENHSINTDLNLDLYNKIVPGGTNICIGEFKKLLNSDKANYIYTL